LKEFSIEEETINLKYDTRNLNNLHEILLYSPRVLDNFDKILFIFYQLLIFTRYLHSINLNCGEIKLSDIYIDKSYWIRIKLPLENILNLYKVTESELIDKCQIFNNEDEYNYEELDEYDIDTTGLLSNNLLRDNLADVYDSYRHLTFSELANITKDWCDKKLSNFNYLLIINCIAGRKLLCPYNHPIFPWVSDFQSLNTNLRDLSVSKFRLNKGDAHLDLIYQASKTSSAGPYHLTEFLSEITYFVYKSRNTSKEILCQHVRRQWEPNEYPVSISRLYLWTPEECIPEFFCDTNIFKSIHSDLPDLKVPDWCNGSVEEFIRTHRLLLDSDLVSKKLHNWIDLTFGYKLSGEAAIEAKNVCLPLIDNHQNMKPHGIVQLFSVPHPIKGNEKIFHSEKPPKIKNKYRSNKDMVIFLE
jgi:WD repeat-containing protein 81